MASSIDSARGGHLEVDRAPGPQRDAEQVPGDEEDVHVTRTTTVYGIISETTVPMPALLVALADQDDERQVDHQRRDHVDRRVADAVGGEHGLRRDAEAV